jgi:hypothetical protein
MADKAEATKKEPKKKETAAQEETSGMMQKPTKAKWTVERAMKAARRFDTEDAWKAGAPASYKAAISHGWVAACIRHMNAKVKPLRRSA